MWRKMKNKRNKLERKLDEYNHTNQILDLPDTIPSEDLDIIYEKFYNIIKLSPTELSNKINNVMEHLFNTGEIVIVGVHPRDAHIIFNRVKELIRESPDSNELTDSNEEMYGGSKRRTYKKKKKKLK